MAMETIKEALPYTDSTPLLEDPPALQQRARDEGYLYFKGLLDCDSLMTVRRSILELCRKHGWLKEGAPLMDAIPAPGVFVYESPSPEWIGFYRDLLRLRDFHVLAMDPRILMAMGSVFGEQAITHSRNICRVVFPGSQRFTTPPHQDHWYIGGTKDTWTCWIPLGDCPQELGALALVPGSNKRGLLSMKPAEGPGGHSVGEALEDAQWVTSDLSCGDVLVFHSLTIHQGRDNLTERLRVSVDYRYQPLSHPVRRDSMLPHGNGLGQNWDDIYADWPQDDPLKYYWKQWDLNWVQ